MSDFDISKYKKKKKKDSEPENSVVPAWVSQGTPATSALYQAVLSELELIEVRIRDCADGQLAHRERQIVNKAIAEKAGLDPSILSPRRQPEIIRMINSENERLDVLWRKIHGRKPSKNKPKKEQLEIENKLLKQQLRGLQAKNIKEAFRAAVETEALEAQLALANKVQALTVENAELLIQVASLRNELRKFTLTAVK